MTVTNGKGFARKQSWPNWGHISALLGGTEENHQKLRMADVPAKIRTVYFPNKNVEH
jgi:hypothetical protein